VRHRGVSLSSQSPSSDDIGCQRPLQQQQQQLKTQSTAAPQLLLCFDVTE